MSVIKSIVGDKDSNIDLIEFCDDEMMMADVSVEDVHCYFANGLLTHNCSEELVIAGNLSGESVYLEAIKHGEDLHMKVAKMAFGVEDESKRDFMKTCSFLKNYGGEPPTLAKRLKISLEEAERIFVMYDKVLSHLTRWKKAMIDYARKNGMVFTYYGRPRILWQYYASPDRGMKAFADRSAVNSVIQGNIIESSRVLTDRGMVCISELKHLVKCDSTEPVPGYRVWNGEKWCEFGLYDHGVEDTKRVLLEDGSWVDSGTKHLFKAVTDNGIVDIHISDLKVGDILVKSYPDSIEYGETFCSDFDCYAAGRYLGDGYINDLGILEICCSLSEVVFVRDMFSHYYSVGKVHFSIRDDGRDVDEIKRILPCDGSIVFCKNRKGDSCKFAISKEDSKFLNLLGFRYGKNAKSKRISDEVFKLSIRQRAHFIKGFYDSDGSKTLNIFSWHLCQRPLLEDLQLLLRTCGIRSRINDASDGTFILNVVESEKFAKFIGVEDKQRTFKKHGRIQDTCMTPRYLELEFLQWWDSVKSNDYYKTRGISDSQWNRDRSIISKLRKNKGCGISTFYSLCDSLGYDYGMKFLPMKVKAIRQGERGQTFCLCLWDDSHQYEANGMIHHNCLPSDSFIESPRAACKLEAFYGRPVFTPDSREGVPTHRGEGQYVMLWSDSGEFLVCDTNHELLSNSKETNGYKCHKVSEGLVSYVLSSKLQSKVLPNPLKVLKQKKSNIPNTLISWTLSSWIEFTQERNAVVWAAYLKGVKMKLDYSKASSLRTILSVFGFNLCYNQYDDLFFVSPFRERKIYLTHFKLLGKGPIASLTMRWGYQYYPAAGFMNKNTGADVMRQLLCRIYLDYEKNPELRANFVVAWHVHDEVDGYVKKNWVHKGFLYLQDVQTVVHSNWEVPLEAETGIGTNWGNGVDLEYVSPEGRFLPKKETFFNEEDYYNERERCGLDRNGPKWKPKKVLDFYASKQSR